jgi:serine/threonine-protein kinase RsbW
MAATTVQLVVPSELRLVDLVHTACEKMAEVAGLGPDDALNVGLAAREAVINAMLHGNGEDPALPVEVTLKVDPDVLEVRISDRGAGFDPAATPDPTEQDNLLRTSGRGLLLIRAFVDRVEFESPPGGGTVVVLTKRRPSSNKAERKGRMR